MTDEFLIVQVYHPQGTGIGDFIYRIEQPSRAMGQTSGVKVINVNIYSPHLKELCRQADVLILHMVSEQDILPVMEERKRVGLPTVYEISDNFIAFQSRDPMRTYFDDPLNLATTFQYIHIADAVQVTSKALADTFGFLNPSFVVFENQLIRTDTFKARGNGPVTVGWAGSVSHLDDLQWIKPTLLDFFRKYPDVHFSYMGTRQGFAYFKDIPEPQRSYTPPGSLYDYYRFLGTIDIGLAPLLPTEYNRCRSDIKFIEYASRGVAPILSALEPYNKSAANGLTALLFADETELFRAVETLVKDRELRVRVAKNACEYAKKDRQEIAHASRRVEFYRGLCERKAEKHLPDIAMKRLGFNTEAYVVKKTEVERLVSQGHVSYMRGDVKGELNSYKEAIEAKPEYYIPYLRLGDTFLRDGNAEAINYLEAAAGMSPDSLRSRLLLGLALLEQDTQLACRQFEGALKISTLYAPAWDALGRVGERLGNHGNAARFFNLALKANPFYSLAPLGSGRSHLAMGQEPEALRLLRLADDILPVHIESRLDLAGLFLKMGRLRDAIQQCEKILEVDPSNPHAHRFLNQLRSSREHRVA